MLTIFRRRDGETFSCQFYQGVIRVDGDDPWQGQQGRSCQQHHVYCGSISAILESALEIPQDCGQQTLRIYA